MTESARTRASVKLPLSLDIAGVADWKTRLEAHLGVAELCLDAAQLTRADTAGLQLLYGLVQEMRRRDARVVWKKPSRALVRAAELLGLHQELGL